MLASLSFFSFLFCVPLLRAQHPGLNCTSSGLLQANIILERQTPSSPSSNSVVDEPSAKAVPTPPPTAAPTPPPTAVPAAVPTAPLTAVPTAPLTAAPTAPVTAVPTGFVNGFTAVPTIPLTDVETVKLAWLESRGISDPSDSKVTEMLQEGQDLIDSEGGIIGRGNGIVTDSSIRVRVQRVLSVLAQRVLVGRDNTSVVQRLTAVVDAVVNELDCPVHSASFVYNFDDVAPALILSAHALGEDAVSNVGVELGKCLMAPTENMELGSDSFGLAGCPKCLNTDWIYTAAPELIGFLTVLDQSGANEMLMLKQRAAIEHHLTPYVSEDRVDGLKYDGSGYHHWTFYPGYMYAYGRLSSAALPLLASTQFQVSRGHLDNLRDHAILQQVLANPVKMSRGLRGRNPWSATKTINLESVGTLYDTISISDPIIISVRQGGKNLDGFWQANYGNLGVLRASSCDSGFECSWTVTFKGFTSELWGAEIYSKQNRFGRYQGFGEVSVSLPKDNDGVDEKGWDWNHPPGTTTVKLPFDELLPMADRMDTFAGTDFAGSLRVGLRNWALGSAGHGRLLVQKHRGSYGIFGFQIQQPTGSFHNGLLKGNLAFKQSCTAFEDVVFCAGTDIRASGGAHVVTTLSQETGAATDTLPPDFVENDCNVLQPGWFGSGRGVKYYVWENDVHLCHRVVDSPDDSGTGINTGKSLLAYIDHGQNPAGSSYAYAFLIGDSGSAGLVTSAKFLQRDADVHVLRRGRYQGLTVHSYTFFGAAVLSPEAGPVRASTAPSLVSTVYSDAQPNFLQVSVAVPSAVNSDREIAIILTMWCSMVLEGEDNSGAAQKANTSGRNMTVYVKYGEPADLIVRFKSPECAKGCTMGWRCTDLLAGKTALEDILQVSSGSGQWLYKGLSTGVAFGNAQEACDDNFFYCAGENDSAGVGTFGWTATQVAALNVAIKALGSTHPQQPGSCNLGEICAELNGHVPLSVTQRLSLVDDMWTFAGQSTCIAAGPPEDACDEKKSVCAGNNRIGSYSDQVVELKLALSSSSKLHPDCPKPCDVTSLCNGCTMSWRCNDLYISGLDIHEVVDISAESNQWFYKGLPTGVGYGNYGETCDSSLLVCAGQFDSDGAGKYGWTQTQATRVRQALRAPARLHPDIPGSCSWDWRCDDLINAGISTGVAARIRLNAGAWTFDGKSTCVAAGNNGSPCDANVYVCSAGDKHGWTAAQVELVKIALLSPGLVHPLCPTKRFEMADEFLL